MRQLVGAATLLVLAWGPQVRADIAFIGDSISTGGAAHPHLQLSQKPFLEVLRGEVALEPDADYYERLQAKELDFEQMVDRPQRLYPSVREYVHPLLWFADHLWLGFSSQYLDAEKYSWSYIVARNLGFEPNRVLLAAKDGERMEHGIAQLDRVLATTQGTLPEHTAILFTGNDLCGPTFDYVTTGADFREHLENTLEYYYRNVPADSNEVRHVWLIEPLGVLQIVTSPSILSHKVPYKGKQLSCRELQTMSPAATEIEWPPPEDLSKLVFELVAGTPAGYCPTLFAIHGENGSDMNVKLANRILSYREAIRAVAQKLSAKFRQRSIRLHTIQSTSQVVFQGEDMANDCFHLNLNGHMKVAARVLQTMRDLMQPEL